MTHILEPLVLSWQGPDEEARLASARGEQPPEYESAQKPTTNVRYTFSPVVGTNAMLLVPPANSPDTRPKYYIAVTMNVFMPTSYITSIYRGTNESGELVGEFEMGQTKQLAKVFMPAKRVKCSIRSIVKRTSGLDATGKFSWTPPDHPERDLKWDYSYTPKCVPNLWRGGPAETKGVFAWYTDPAQVRNGDPFLPKQLEVTPLGHDHFDELLISLLIIERRRMQPTGAEWNF